MSRADLSRTQRLKRRRTSLLALLVAVIVLGTAGTAVAFFNVTVSGNSALAQADSLPKGATPDAPTAVGSNVTITFAQVSTSAASGSVPITAYTLHRYPTPGAATSIGSCDPPASNVVTCHDSSVPDGTYTYTDTPTYGASWVGPESDQSASVTVTTVVTPTKLAFTTQPATNANIAAKGTGSFAVSVAVQDASGNTVTTDNRNVTLAIGTNAGPGGALSCTNVGGLTVAASSGVANFTGCAITKTGTGYTLTATSSPSLTAPANANAFNITGGTATQIVFSAQPSGATAASTNFPIQPVVTAKDVNGNTATSYATTVTLTKNAGTGNLLGCTAAVAPLSGVATFSGCQMSATGNGDSLKATSGALTATSNNFNITGVATKVVFTTQPSTTATAGQALAQQPVVSVEDASGNVVTANSSTVVLAISTNPASGTLTCTSPLSNPASYGVATFAGCSLDKSSTSPYVLKATDGAFPVIPSGNITVSPGAPTQLTFSTQPSTTATGGTAFGTQPQVTVKDANGNLVTSSPVTLTVTSGSGGGAGGTLSCTNNTVNTNPSGVATFAGCSIDTASATAYTLTATDGAATSPVSSGITVSVGTASKFLVSAPASATAGVSFSGITLTAEDAGGNLVTGYIGSHTISWGAPASPSGMAANFPVTAVSFTAGVSTTTVSATLFASGSDTITASASSPTVTGSTTIAVGAGAGSQLGFTNVTNGTTPGTVSGCPFSCVYSAFGRSKTASASVSVVDTWGNVKSAIGTSVLVSLSAAGGLSPSSVTVPASGAAQSPQFVYTSQTSNSWSVDTITASASGFSNLTMTINKS